jgi:hypothetical protein
VIIAAVTAAVVAFVIRRKLRERRSRPLIETPEVTLSDLDDGHQMQGGPPEARQ